MIILILTFLNCISNVLSRSPNVLLLVIDDLKPALNCYGDSNAYTPNIDSIAKKSFIFSNAYAQQSLCAPSRNSFLTSRRPDTLRLYDFYSYWRDEVGNFTTLPQYFKERNYFTYSIGKIFHPGISSNFTDDYPYSWSTKAYHPKTEIYMNSKVCVDKGGNLAKNLICPVTVELQPDGTLPDMESLEEGVRFLKDNNNKTPKPFFLAIGFHKPHVPFRFPVKYLDYHPLEKIPLPSNRWRPSLLPTVAWNPWSDIRSRDDIKQLNISFPFGPMSGNIMQKIIQAYNAATSYIDDLIGQLLVNVDDNTIVVITGDHGWSRGEHGEFAKYSNFDEATRVPLIIHVPEFSESAVVLDSLVELVDLFPTLVDLTKISRPLKTCPKKNSAQNIICTEGRSLVPLMTKSIGKQVTTEKSAIFSQYPRPGVYPTAIPNSDKPRLKEIKIMGYSIRTKRHRYTEWVKFNVTTFRPNWKKVYARELYDHLLDPKEDMNLADRKEMGNIINSLRKQLILDVVLKNKMLEKATEKSVEMAMKNWLRHAKDRIKRVENKVPQIQNNVEEEVLRQ